jgi:hypothetical protein
MQQGGTNAPFSEMNVEKKQPQAAETRHFNVSLQQHKIYQRMKKHLLGFSFIVLSLSTKAQAGLENLFVDEFNYTAPGVLAATTNWIAFSGAGSNAIQLSAGDLAYPGITQMIGSGKISIVSTSASAEDVYRQFTAPISSGSVYFTALIKIASTNTTLSPNTDVTAANYFMAFLPSTSTTSFGARLGIRQGSVAGTFNLGIRTNAGTGAPNSSFVANNLAYDVVHRIVVEYKFIAGTNNDEVNLWINPDIYAATPPAPDATSTGWATAELADVQRVVIRQGGIITPVAEIDRVAAGTNWPYFANLPVSLLSFGGQVANNSIALNWNVANEVNMAQYEVEHSTDGRSFTGFANIAAYGANKYYALHLSPVAGINYYRLKLVNKDGSFSYSKTIAFNLGKGVEFALYPNPATDYVVVKHGALSNGTVTITNALGQAIKTIRVSNGGEQTWIAVADLPRGNYVARFNNGNETKAIQFVKQ